MILNRIVLHKKKEISASKKRIPLLILKKIVSLLPKKKPSFLSTLRASRGMAIIAEIKRKSPSKGILRKKFNPAAIAQSYRKGGASALSVLTDEKFFGGSAAVLKTVRKAVSLPILRKDFILDEYQVYESCLLGADAILLIAGILSRAQMMRLSRLARSLGLDVLFEVHSLSEMKKVRTLKPRLVGINNRDLRTFRTDITQTARLVKEAPSRALLVSESGIQTREDLIYLRALGVKAVLVGESLMREKDITRALKKLRGIG